MGGKEEKVRKSEINFDSSFFRFENQKSFKRKKMFFVVYQDIQLYAYNLL